MTSRRFKQLLDQLFGGNRTACAAMLGYDVRQVRRMASGETPVPPVVAMLLEVIADRKLKPDHVRKLVA